MFCAESTLVNQVAVPRPSCKYQLTKGFAGINEARRCVRAFVRRYNEQHRHGEIRYVTPSQRHAELDEAILKERNRYRPANTH